MTHRGTRPVIHTGRPTVSRAARLTLVTLSLTAGLGFIVAGDDALAARRNTAQVAQIRNLETPKGLQGSQGAGENVVFPFALVHRNRKQYDVEGEYGFDANGDGIINDGVLLPASPVEYFPMTEDRRDPRNTRKNKGKQLYRAAAGIGAAQSQVWRSTADVGTASHPTLQYQYSADGRPVPDPDNPGSFLFAANQAGMKGRFRAVKPGSGRKNQVAGPWVYTDAFATNNNTAPEMTIDAIIPNTTSVPTASDEIIEVLWTAYDQDSEDLNGNGVLDVQDLEDLNGNGVLDPELVKVAFDYYRLLPGENPQAMTPEELDGLGWLPCTAAVGVGDPVSGVPSAPPLRDPDTNAIIGGGVQHTFAWDSAADVKTVHADFILRARPNDEKFELGEFAYVTTPFTIDNWKIFYTAGPGSSLPAGRVGAAVVNMTPNLPFSDSFQPVPLSEIGVFGGATVADGGGTTTVGIGLVNNETAETTTISVVTTFASLGTPRSYATATELDDGRILIAGGFNGSGSALATTEIYNPNARSFEVGPPLLTARAKHAAVLLADGNVAFFGGIGSSGAPINKAEIYHFAPFGDPLAPNSALPDMERAQHSPSAVLLPDQTVLVTGGIDASGNGVQVAQLLEPFFDLAVADPTTKDPRFVTVGSMLAERRFASITPLIDGNVLVAGGAASPSSTGMEVFNYLTRQFEPVTVPMEEARAQHAAVRLGDGSVLLAGGTADPENNVIVPQADVFVLGARNDAAATWSGSFTPTNGNMYVPRRLASAVALNNGRALFVGGLGAAGASLSGLEIYTPENGANFRPSSRTVLRSAEQSWAFGAPIIYRLSDPEQDLVRVVTQWSRDAGTTWHAAQQLDRTIGSDVAEPLAGLTSGLSDNELATISPATFPVSDHLTIWWMERDILRPAPGTTESGYVFRNVPYGAVRGDAAKSGDVTVLYNTKVIPTIIALEDDDGTPNHHQGGDVRIWVHLRDIDGAVKPGPGDAAECLFEYAIDENLNGLIEDPEFWYPMSASGAGVDPSKRGDEFGASRLTGLSTYSEAPADSNNIPGARTALFGWSSFDWDSVYDIGVPPTTFGDKVWIRATPFDNLGAPVPDEGFQAVFRNSAGEHNLEIVPDPDALWLRSFSPAGGNPNAVAVNEPLIFEFNGLVDPLTVTSETLEISRNGVEILGVRVVEQNVPNAGDTTITFYPQIQNTNNDVNQWSPSSGPTILFPLSAYDIVIPGYTAQQDLTATTIAGGGADPGFMLPDNAGWPAVLPTYLLVQNRTDQLAFSTVNGSFNDGATLTITDTDPIQGSTLSGLDPFTLQFDHGLDVSTVRAPNLQVFRDSGGGVNSVVPGNWTVVNTLQPDGSIITTATFTPLVPYPPGSNIKILATAGLLSSNGTPVQNGVFSPSANGFGITFVTDARSRVNASITENYDNTTRADLANTTASWGLDPCNPGYLTGLQGSGTPPNGSGGALTVLPGQTVTITATTSDYTTVDVRKGGTLLVRASSAATIRTTGDFIVNGVLDFRGENGYSGQHGNAASSTTTAWYYASRSRGTRAGGRAFNGGNAGGMSASSTSNGNAGTVGDGGASGGGPGLYVNVTSSTTSRYGSGGAAGGGHGTEGIAGGAQTRATSSGNVWLANSVPGAEAGDRNFVNGATVGGGGGGGGSDKWSSTFYFQGGAGGASGGALTLVVQGTFRVGPSGLVDGRGGDGGASSHYGGSGGGGAGGGLFVKTATEAILDGIIDLRGGKGGPNGYAMNYYESYHWSNATTTSTTGGQHFGGSTRYGGNGGLGRFVLEAGNLGSTDAVRVYGQLMTRKVNSIPGPVGSAGSVPPAWTNGGTVAFGSNATAHYNAPLTVPAGRIVTLTGNNAVTVYVDGDITIAGTVRLNGNTPTLDHTGSTTIYDYGSASVSAPSSSYSGAAGNLGGGAGGNPHNASAANTAATVYRRAGTNGAGAAPGLNKTNGSSSGYNRSYAYFFLGQTGGSGGGNATQGLGGWAPYAVCGRYSYVGAVTDTSGAGRSGTLVEQDHSQGGAQLDSSTLAVSNLGSFAGSGGGGGNSGGYAYSYYSWNYYGYAGSAGSGAGALGLVTSGTINVTGTIEAKGGDGNMPGSADSWYPGTPYGRNHSGGGAGSGGTVYLVGNDVNIGPVTVGEGGGANGATVDLRGGIGGGWRQHPLTLSTVLDKFPSYKTSGNFGGDGGFGRLVIDYQNELNGGRVLFNRWGMEQSVFKDTTQVWETFAGTATARCGGQNDGATFQSDWILLGGLNDVVNSLAVGSVTNASVTIQGQGAQYQAHATNPDPLNTSLWVNPGAGMLRGYPFMRYGGSFTRPNTSPGSPFPTIGTTTIGYQTDGP